MKAAVWGSPISHSLSPALHRAAYAALDLDWEYDLEEVDAAALPAALSSLGGDWAGVSLTMPLKAAVIPLLAEVSPLAAAVGAVNTLVPALDPAGVRGSGAWRGENTDVHGIVAALAEVGVVVGDSTTAAVLGGGATAASAIAALAQLGVAAPVVHVRSPQRAAPLIEVGARLGVDVRLRPWSDSAGPAEHLLDVDVVVSTAPAGAADGIAAALGSRSGPSGSSGASGAVDPRGALLDVVYEPWPTPLAAAWRARGGRAVGGFAMLVHQAERQVELMTGRRAPLAAMRAAGEAAVAERLLRR